MIATTFAPRQALRVGAKRSSRANRNRARDLESGSCVVSVADKDSKSKVSMPVAGIGHAMKALMVRYKRRFLERAKLPRPAASSRFDSYDAQEALGIDARKLSARHWDGTPMTEKRIKDETQSHDTLHPLRGSEEPRRCILTGAPRNARGFGQAY